MSTQIEIKSSRRPSRARRLIGGLMTAAVITSVIGFGLFGLGTIFGDVGARYVRTGSMAPYMNPGDLVITRRVEASHLKVGDVIVRVVPNLVTGGDTSETVTHRITAIRHHGLTATIEDTKGDANAAPDIYPAREVGSAQRVIFVVPKIGRIVNWLFTGFRVPLSPIPLPLRSLGLGLALIVAYLNWPRRDEDQPAVTVTHEASDPDLHSDVDPALVDRIKTLIGER